MRPSELRERLLDQIESPDDGRQYLGMSQIGRCPRALALELRDGRPPMGYRAKLGCHEGLLHEMDILRRLDDAGLGSSGDRGQYEVSLLGGRFVGHIDDVLDTGDIVEIKTATCGAFEAIVIGENLYKRRLAHAQVQAYLHAINLLEGRRPDGYIIWKCRETGDIWVNYVRYDMDVGHSLVGKARHILHHLDEDTLPECTCGRCP